MMGCSTPEHSTGKVILTENCLCSPEQTLQGAQAGALLQGLQQPLQGLLLAPQREQPKHHHQHQGGTNLPQKRFCSLGEVCLNSHLYSSSFTTMGPMRYKLQRHF